MGIIVGKRGGGFDFILLYVLPLAQFRYISVSVIYVTLMFS